MLFRSAVNGIKIATSEQLITRINAYRYGTTIELTVQRRIEGEYNELVIPITLMPKDGIPNDDAPNDNDDDDDSRKNKDSIEDKNNNMMQ